MPPRVLPAVASATASAACCGCSFRKPNSTASEENGTTVAARKLATNKPARPPSGVSSVSTDWCARLFSMKREDYLERILRARVYDVALESPLELAPALSRRLHNRLLLKREDLQPVFSFKLRGAYNKMVNLPRNKLARGLIAASAGNHAQGVALAAQKLGCRAVVVMPVTAPKIKVDAVAARGAQVILRGDSYSDAYRYAMR